MNEQILDTVFRKREGLIYKNGFIISNAGEGKQFLVKGEIERILSQTDDDVFIVGDGGFLGLAEIEELGGRNISLHSSAPICINPLDADVWNGDEDAITKMCCEKFDLFVTVLEKLAGTPTAVMRSCLDYAIKQTYMASCNRASGGSDENGVPVLDDLIEKIHLKDERIANVFERIKGCGCFHHQTNMVLSHRLNAFHLSGLGEFSGIGTLFVLEYIRSVVKRNHKAGKRTWVYIEDFDELLCESTCNQYVTDLWKRGRMLGCIYTALLPKERGKRYEGLWTDEKRLAYYDNDDIKPLLYNSTYMVITCPSKLDMEFVNTPYLKDVDEGALESYLLSKKMICMINNESILVD